MSRAHAMGWAALGAGAMALGLMGVNALRTNGDAHQAAAIEGEKPGESAGLAPDKSSLDRMGIKTAMLSAASETATTDGYARGLDAAPLAAILAEIETAQAAAGASRAEAARLAALFRQDVSASRRSVEAAQAQAAADTARVRLAQQRVGLEFGSGLMRLGAGGLQRLVADIANGRSALVRIDVPGIALPAGTRVELGDGATATSVSVLGPAAAADARLQSAGVLAIVSGPVARQIQTGRIIPARVAAGSGVRGVLVPREAILRAQGKLWLYRQDGKRFEKVELIGAQPFGDGWFVREGVKPGDVVVVAGAAGLLAMETGGGAAAEAD